MFYCLTAVGLHESLGFSSGAIAIAGTFATILLASCITHWVLADARKRHRSVSYDFGSFVFFAWPVLVPMYLFSTRGWRAFATYFWFLVLYIAATVAVFLWLTAVGQ
jgi:hypothetical protein